MTKTTCFFAAKDSFQAFAHQLQWWIQSSYRTRRNNESRVEKEQSPYLGRPSSGAPDLEGKQEHSQQWTREHGKVVLSHWQKCFVTGICFLWDVCITEGNQRAFFNHWLECFGLRVTELQFKHWVLFYCVFFSVQYLQWQKIIKCFQIQPIPLIIHLSLSYFDYIALNTLLGGLPVLYMRNDV